MQRVVITGMGAVSPFGRGVHALWSGLREGDAAITEFDLFDTTDHRTSLAGVVPDLAGNIHEEFLARGNPGRLTRTDLFALAAGKEAIEQAGLKVQEDLLRGAGLFFGSSTGGMLEGEHLYLSLSGYRPSQVSNKRFSRAGRQPVCSSTDTLGQYLGLGGPVETVASACSAATMALESAICSLRSGETQLTLAGGSDGLCELTYGGFNSLRAVDERPTRPFRKDRGGLSLGEGAGVLVLETLEHARARGARVLAEVAGTGTCCDAFHMTAPHPEGAGAAQAMCLALDDAGLDARCIDFVNAHGTGTPHNDAAEWLAISSVFGDRAASLPVTSTKGAVGHLLGACGALETIVTVCCLRAGEVHTTPGSGMIDEECPVDLVLGEPRALQNCRAALSINLAFGGANAAIVLLLPENA